MKSCLEYIYNKEEVIICLNCNDYNTNYSGFLIPQYERSFLENLTWFLRLLSAVCFCDLFEIRIMNYLRAIDSPVSFLSLTVLSPF